MKKILYTFLAASLLFSGCKGFLEEDNKSNIVSPEFYKTAAGFNSLLNSCYSSLRTLYGGSPNIFLSGTDLYLVGRARGHTDSPLGMYAKLDPANGDVRTFYQRCFESIGLTNSVLYYSEITEQTEDLPRQIAEARFLRAFYYFHLVQQFGGVAIVEEMTDRPILEFPRNTESQVYEFIITEMEAIKGQLIVKSEGTNYGRIDQRTCNHFLAKMYLTRGWINNAGADFQKAKDYGIAAIDGKKLTLSFEEAYAAMNYAYRNEEVIWSVTYSPNTMETTTSGNTQASHFGGYLDGSPAGNKPTDGSFPITLYGHYIFAKDIDDPNNDSRYDLTFIKYVYDHSYRFYTESAENLKSIKISAYYPTWWNVDYDPADINASWRAENLTQRDDTKVRNIPAPPNPETDYEGWLAASLKFTEDSNTNYYYPTFRKFDCPETPVHSTSGSYRDIDLARLNDTYLTVAEACFKLNDHAGAATYINEVRERSIDASDPKRSITADLIDIDFILDERGRELMGHYDRWYDLKRTNTLVERAVKYNADLEGKREMFKGQDGNDKILRPIPQSAIDANKAIVEQNPGYPK